jgi:Protein of unknown function (DUF3300)
MYRGNISIFNRLSNDFELMAAALNITLVFRILVRMPSNLPNHPGPDSAHLSCLSASIAFRRLHGRPRLLSLIGIVAALVACGQAGAQDAESNGAYGGQASPESSSTYPSDQGSGYGDQASTDSAPPAHPPLARSQLEQLVAPIALYPDALVAQVLAASTYSEQVVEADRWRAALGYATADQIASAADAQNWDPSVKALTAFPGVLAEMARNLQWTIDLGNAYFNQPQDVLEAVQVMRQRAQAAGTLRTTPQEAVRYEGGNIELAPVDPEFVYVPTYNPWAVYGEPVAPYPGFSLLGTIGNFLGSGVLRYGFGIAMSAFAHTPWGWLAWGLDWLAHSLMFHQSAYDSHSATVAHWGLPHRGFYAYPGHGGFSRGAREYARSWGGGGGRSNESHAGGWHSFERGSERRLESGRENWGEGSSRGFASFPRDGRSLMTGGNGLYRTPGGIGEEREQPRSAYRGRDETPVHRGGEGFSRSDSYRASAGNFPRSPLQGSEFRSSETRGSEFRAGEFGGKTAGSLGRSSGKSHSGGSHWFGGGHSEKSFSRGFGGGHGSSEFGGGKGFRSKSFRSKSFGGGHAHREGGHSSGGGGKHHR